MLIHEVLIEDQSNIVNDLEELITRAKANEKMKIPTNIILAKLRGMGYSVSVDSLLDLLAKITSVGSSNKKDVTLDTVLPRSNTAPEDKTVKKMAQKQISKDDSL